MSNIILFPISSSLNSTDKMDLTRDAMNWPKITQDIQITKAAELKKILRPWYKKLIQLSENNQLDVERFRFLDKVKSSFEIYMQQDDHHDIEYPLYYLLLYYLEDGMGFYSTIDDKDLVHLECDDSISTKVIAFMINQFRDSLKTKNDVLMIESFLSYVLQK